MASDRPAFFFASSMASSRYPIPSMSPPAYASWLVKILPSAIFFTASGVILQLLRVRSILFAFYSDRTGFCSHMWSARRGDQQLNAECIHTNSMDLTLCYEVPRLREWLPDPTIHYKLGNPNF